MTNKILLVLLSISTVLVPKSLDCTNFRPASASQVIENRQKIVVIDTGIVITARNQKYLCDKSLHRDYTGTGLYDKHGHGSHIASIIIEGMNYKTQCLVIIKYFDPIAAVNAGLTTVLSLKYAKSLSPTVVNYSSSGFGRVAGEKAAIEDLLVAGVTVVVAAGNDSINLTTENCQIYPACHRFAFRHFENFAVVANGRKIGSFVLMDKSSNRGAVVTHVRNGTVRAFVGNDIIEMNGTSQAAAKFSKEKIKGRQ